MSIYVLIVVQILSGGHLKVTYSNDTFTTIESCEEVRLNFESRKTSTTVGNTACIEIYQGKKENI